MQLQLDIIKLRKQVLRLWRWMRKNKRNIGQVFVNPGAETTSTIVHTKHFFHLLESWEFLFITEI